MKKEKSEEFKRELNKLTQRYSTLLDSVIYLATDLREVKEKFKDRRVKQSERALNEIFVDLIDARGFLFIQ